MKWTRGSHGDQTIRSCLSLDPGDNLLLVGRGFTSDDDVGYFYGLRSAAVKAIELRFESGRGQRVEVDGTEGPFVFVYSTAEIDEPESLRVEFRSGYTTSCLLEGWRDIC